MGTKVVEEESDWRGRQIKRAGSGANMIHRVGGFLTETGARFCVWAPTPRSIELYLPGPPVRIIPMERTGDYWQCDVTQLQPGTRYFFRLDGTDNKPDPASRFQPDGVHGASELVLDDYSWSDHAWQGLPLHRLVFYELHVGTYTKEGTFEAVIPQLPRLKDLGITAIELMPIGQFPGRRNWGYDGVYPYAPQSSYGGPAGMKKLVDTAHGHGLAVFLDVIYNHLGPEGNYFARYAPYFTCSYKTPWGDAINYDGPDSGPVRAFFLDNAEYWLREFHIDGLRLDAAHEIYDKSPLHFLAELQERINALENSVNRRLHLVAESDANDVRYLKDPALGGYGLDGQWMDDFHHAFYTQITGTDSRRYDADYKDIIDIEKTYAEGFVYSGQYCTTRKRRHGTGSAEIAGERLVVFMQNHDQVGNKLRGTRIAAEVSFEAAKLAAACTILSPYLPLLFMGEEMCETRPFIFFVDHSDPDLVKAVREGRRKDFMMEEDTGEFPDPQSPDTFDACILDFGELTESGEGVGVSSRKILMWRYYQELLRLRREVHSIATVRRQDTRVKLFAKERTLLTQRWAFGGMTLLILNLSPDIVEIPVPFSFMGSSDCIPEQGSAYQWNLSLDSASEKWNGPGSLVPEVLDIDDETRERSRYINLRLRPESAVLYAK